MATEIKLPELGEGLEGGEVLAVRVKPGDTVSEGQTLLEIDAEKATVEVPAPMAGRVTELRVKKGDVIKVGQAFCVLEASNGAAEATPAPKAESKPKPTEKPPPEGDGRQKEKNRTPAPEAEVGAASRAAPEAPQAPLGSRHLPTAPPSEGDKPVLAGPATRRLARQLGVDLHAVVGSGPSGRVSEDDVRGYVRQLASGETAAPVGGKQAPALPDFERWGPVERQPLEPIRRRTAQQMALAWSQVVHVTQHDLADITDLDAFRKQQEGQGPKLTVTAFALKAAAIALRQFPAFNASLDLANGQLVLKRYYHIGVAVDTEQGLLVPVVRDVDRKSVQELAAELTELAERARERRTKPDEMRGGTFTITNLGGIGGTSFTPIVNYPEVAILGLSRARLQPAVHKGEMALRLMLPLSLSYDHRVIDGANAARFTRRIAEMLENPLVMLLHA